RPAGPSRTLEPSRHRGELSSKNRPPPAVARAGFVTACRMVIGKDYRFCAKTDFPVCRRFHGCGPAAAAPSAPPALLPRYDEGALPQEFVRLFRPLLEASASAIVKTAELIHERGRRLQPELA